MSSAKKVAYRAKGDAKISGSVSYGDGQTLDIGARLSSGGGSISVEPGSAEDVALSGHPALTTAPAPKASSSKED